MDRDGFCEAGGGFCASGCVNWAGSGGNCGDGGGSCDVLAGHGVLFVQSAPSKFGVVFVLTHLARLIECRGLEPN